MSEHNTDSETKNTFIAVSKRFAIMAQHNLPCDVKVMW